jgi:hypothetical protein
MTTPGEDLPVLQIDGANFSDLAGFAREFSKLLCHYTWRGNLDAFNDILRGGFGTPDRGWVLQWINSQTSRSVLGYEATLQRLEAILLTCHPSHHPQIKTRIGSALRHEGPTLFDQIIEIIGDHGPGGDEAEDNVFLTLL